MKVWRWLKRLCFRKQRWLEVRRMPVGIERAAIERGWSGRRLAECAGRGERHG